MDLALFKDTVRIWYDVGLKGLLDWNMTIFYIIVQNERHHALELAKERVEL
jgi:hypothetical protein